VCSFLAESVPNGTLFFITRKERKLKSVKVEEYALMHIGEESVDAVLAFIRQHQICQKCRNSVNVYGHDLVGRYCLACVLEEQPTLTYLGYDHTDTDNRAVYRFRSESGSIYTSTAGLTDKPSEDVALALREAGFTLPTTYTPFKSTTEEVLRDHYWSYYGKITNSVLVLVYHDKYTHGGVYAVFLAYKQAETVEFSKRTTLYKNLMEKATRAAEATKRNGVYNINGQRNVVRLLDDVLYAIVSTLESAAYDAQLSLFAPPLDEQTDQEQEETLQETPETAQESFLDIPVEETATEEQTEQPEVQQPEQSEATPTEEPVSLDTQRKKRTRKEE
jgi:hypothetical protein